MRATPIIGEEQRSSGVNASGASKAVDQRTQACLVNACKTCHKKHANMGVSQHDMRNLSWEHSGPHNRIHKLNK